jgi:hypothetical protein
MIPEISSLDFPSLIMTTQRAKCFNNIVKPTNRKQNKNCISYESATKKKKRKRMIKRPSKRCNKYIRRTQETSAFPKNNIINLIRKEDIVDDIKKINGEDVLLCSEEIFMGISPQSFKKISENGNTQKTQQIVSAINTPDLHCNEMIIKGEDQMGLREDEEEEKEEREKIEENEEEIINFLHEKQREQNLQIDLRNLSRNHPMLNWGKRAVIIDWLMSIAAFFNMKRNTLYMAVNFTDRMLTLEQNISEEGIQLIGIASLYVACKMEVDFYFILKLNLS